MARKNKGTSQDTRTLITVLLLLFAFPVGLITMWLWSRWSTGIQFLITSVTVLFLVGCFVLGFIIGSREAAPKNADTLFNNALINSCSKCLDAHEGKASSCQTECRSFLTPTISPY